MPLLPHTPYFRNATNWWRQLLVTVTCAGATLGTVAPLSATEPRLLCTAVSCDCSGIDAGLLTAEWRKACRQHEADVVAQCRQSQGRVLATCDPEPRGPLAWPETGRDEPPVRETLERCTRQIDEGRSHRDRGRMRLSHCTAALERFRHIRPDIAATLDLLQTRLAGLDAAAGADHFRRMLPGFLGNGERDDAAYTVAGLQNMWLNMDLSTLSPEQANAVLDDLARLEGADIRQPLGVAGAERFDRARERFAGRRDGEAALSPAEAGALVASATLRALGGLTGAASRPGGHPLTTFYTAVRSWEVQGLDLSARALNAIADSMQSGKVNREELDRIGAALERWRNGPWDDQTLTQAALSPLGLPVEVDRVARAGLGIE